MLRLILKHKKKIIIFSFLCFFLFSAGVFAEMEKWNIPAEYKSLHSQGFFKYLENPHDEGLNQNGIVSLINSLLRKLAWGIVYLLLLIVNVMETVFYKITTGFNIFSLIFKNDTSFLAGLATICLFIGIVVAGIRIANPFSEEGKDFLKLLIKGVATIVVIIGIAGFSFITMEKIQSSLSTKIIKNDNKSTSLITSMVGKNVYDIEETFKQKKIVTVPESKVQFININEMIQNRDHEILGYKYNKISEKEIQREKLTKHSATVEFNVIKSNEFFYKYQFNPIILYVILGGLAGLYILNSLKFSRNMYEMFIGFIVLLSSTIDITNQERLKVQINNILGLFFNNIYLIGSIFITTNFILIANILLPLMTANVGLLESSIIYALTYLALFWLMLDGAAIIQQTTGTDGGIRSGTQLIVASYAAAKLIGSPVGKLFGAALSKPAATMAANKEAKQALKREKAITNLKEKELAKNKPQDTNDTNNTKETSDTAIKADSVDQTSQADDKKASEKPVEDSKQESEPAVVKEQGQAKDKISDDKASKDKVRDIEKETNARFETTTKTQSSNNPFNKEVKKNERTDQKN